MYIRKSVSPFHLLLIKVGPFNKGTRYKKHFGVPNNSLSVKKHIFLKKWRKIDIIKKITPKNKKININIFKHVTYYCYIINNIEKISIFYNIFINS